MYLKVKKNNNPYIVLLMTLISVIGHAFLASLIQFSSKFTYEKDGNVSNLKKKEN